MRCTFSPESGPQPTACGMGAGRERCLFTSVMMLGGLFGLMASPAVRLPFVTMFVVIGIPLLTFAVAAPSRLGLPRELGLLLRGLEASLLSMLLAVVGRFDDARAVLLRQRVRVENAYASGTGPLAQIVASDPLRLHHLRRLGMLGAVLAVVAGNALPLVFPQTYTWGDDAGAIGVFVLDVLTIGLASRLVSERMAVRLLETTHALGGGTVWGARARVVPLATMLGTAMGAVGALVVLATAAAASAVETSWLFETDMVAAGLWFIRETAPLALPLGVGIGGVMGAAAGLAQPPQR